ncbi:MAG: sugar transferase [Deltaproteobacteria bacterium]|nr:sugar transferase [Deltaproteobacteria bacterium]
MSGRAGGALTPGLAGRLNLLVDLIVLWPGLLLAAHLSGRSWPELSHEFYWFGLSAASVWIVTAVALRYYAFDANRGTMDHVALTTVLVMAVITFLEIASIFVPPTATFPRVGHVLLVIWPGALLPRLLVFRHLSAREAPQDEVLILGAGPVGRLTGEDMVARGQKRLIGYLAFSDERQSPSLPAPFLGSAKDLEGILRTTPVSQVFIAGNALRNADEMQGAIRVCEKLGMPFALPAYTFRLERAQPVERRAVSDGYLHYQTHDPKPGQMAMKRLFDIVSSAVALWILLVPLSIVALVVKLTSRGPVFFKQVRVGLYGKPFHMLKFRSMVVDAEAIKARLEKLNEQTGPVFKMKNDPRVTRIGRFIRKFSIDELPQLINVLRGDMSIVGPRPPVPSEVAKYEPWQRRRLSVRPGLTCIWQVSGRNQISFEDWMYLDMQYIDHWSLAKDFNLIFKTVPVVFTGRGAS